MPPNSNLKSAKRDGETFYAFGIPQYQQQQQQHHRSPFKHVLKMVNTKRKREKKMFGLSVPFGFGFFFLFLLILTTLLLFDGDIGLSEMVLVVLNADTFQVVRTKEINLNGIFIYHTFCTYNHLLTNNRTKCSKMIVDPLLCIIHSYKNVYMSWKNDWKHFLTWYTSISFQKL